jgi:hypothetical protein
VKIQAPLMSAMGRKLTLGFVHESDPVSHLCCMELSGADEVRWRILARRRADICQPVDLPN